MQKKILLFSLLLLVTPVLFAHSINYSLEDAPSKDVVWFYLKLGFSHIIPAGADHILFVMGLCLLSTNVKTILWQATAFTAAHSVTLALSMKSIVMVPGAVVEPVIALSILFVAIENMLLSGLKPWRILLVFMFGLIHGISLAFTYIIPVAGSTAGPPHSAPPSKPGKITVPCLDGALKN